MSKLIRMKCQDCGHGLEYNRAERIAFCPYCGSQNLLEESDDVKNTDRFYTNLERMQETRLSYEEKKSRNGWMTLRIVLLTIVIAFACLLALAGILQATA